MNLYKNTTTPWKIAALFFEINVNHEKYNLHLLYSVSTPSLFNIYTLYMLYGHPIYTVSTPYIFSIYTFFIQYLLPIYTVPTPSIFSTYTFYIQYLHPLSKK
jgi:hypothetical protein